VKATRPQPRVAWRRINPKHPEDALRAVLRDTEGVDVAVTFLFFSPDLPTETLKNVLTAPHRNGRVLGCSSSGEIGPGGFHEGGISALSLAHPDLRFTARLIAPLSEAELTIFDTLPSELSRELGAELTALTPGHHTFLTFFDGLSGREDLITAYMGRRLRRLPLVGASAGDMMQMKETRVVLDGEVLSDAAVVALLETPEPVVVIHHHHFHPTGEEVQVTRMDRSGRVILELDHLPAIERYATLLGVEPGKLVYEDAVDSPFATRLRGRWSLCSVIQVTEDGLRVARTVAPEQRLMLMRSGDLLTETRAAMDDVAQELGRPPEALLLFNCAGRWLKARAEKSLGALHHAFGDSPLAGLNSYGEQVATLHVNHTLTGIAF